MHKITLKLHKIKVILAFVRVFLYAITVYNALKNIYLHHNGSCVIRS